MCWHKHGKNLDVVGPGNPKIRWIIQHVDSGGCSVTEMMLYCEVLYCIVFAWSFLLHYTERSKSRTCFRSRALEQYWLQCWQSTSSTWSWYSWSWWRGCVSRDTWYPATTSPCSTSTTFTWEWRRPVNIPPLVNNIIKTQVDTGFTAHCKYANLLLQRSGLSPNLFNPPLQFPNLPRRIDNCYDC